MNSPNWDYITKRIYLIFCTRYSGFSSALSGKVSAFFRYTTDYKKTNFWVRDKTQSSAEVDLLIAHGKLLIPIEIKSGKTGGLKSLHQFVNQAPHQFAVRMYGGKFNIEETVTPEGKPYLLMNLPYYLGTYLKQYINYFITKYNVE